MIPDVPTVIFGIMRSLGSDIGSEVRTPYGTMTVQLMSGLLMMLNQEFDRAAARLAEENAALLALFGDAAGTIGDAELVSALRAAATAPAPTLHVSALRAANHTLRALLVRLHAHVEERDDEPARALDARIWQELVASTQRRQLDLANG